MKEKTYLAILKGGVIASLLIVFFVFKDLLFPYITSKQISFNILTELIFALWLVFIMRFPAYRPKKSFITYGLIAYLLAITASCLISVDPVLSFWGDAERMLGVFHIYHFFLLYLVIISVFRSWEDFKMLFISSISIATIVSLIGLFGANTFSTIGNTAYVSGYLIFNIFFAIILFFRENNKKIGLLYLLPALIMLIEFWRCHTSGAIIGLFFSVLLAVFLIGVFHDNKKVRYGALISVLALIVIVVGIFSQYKTDWFQNSFLRNLTTQKVTFQTRLVSWKAAAMDFKNHPVFGTGFGNYAATFDKYFDSKFYSYTTSETYFDRAHNNLIEIASTTGLVGLLTYLSIFLALFYYLLKEMKKNNWRAGNKDLKHRRNLEIIIIISLVSAYFIQNLAIFDSFVTFIGLMMTLGFVYFISEQDEESAPGKPMINSQGGEVACLIVFILVAYIFTTAFNIKPKRMFEGAIKAYSNVLSGDINGGFLLFKDTLKGGPLERDSRTLFINLVTGNPKILTLVKPDIASEMVDFSVSLAQKNVSYNLKDSMMQMQLAQTLDSAAKYYKDIDKEKSSEYAVKAFEAMEESIAASPGRATIYIAKAQMLASYGLKKESIETLEYAASLNTNYYESYCVLAQFHLFYKENDLYAKSLNECIDKGGSASLGDSDFLINSINYYISVDDFERAALLGLRASQIEPNNAQIKLNLAKLYYASGKYEEADAILKEAASLDKNIFSDWQNFLGALGNASSSQ